MNKLFLKNIMCLSLLILPISMLGGIANAKDGRPVIEETYPSGKDQVARVMALGLMLREMSNKIMACVNEGDGIDTCQCKSTAEFHMLRSLTLQTLQLYSSWSNKIINHRETDRDGNVTKFRVSMPDVHAQLDYFDRLNCRRLLPRRR